ncbi:hypothetical protein [Sinorhizobium fredii]|uniref:hypothetical protein n=1 Tax=Rhizobium fredii TaxID=380 RepID=UPI0004BC81B1|nr:hypothetical protein [Sinorhizobium fredii]
MSKSLSASTAQISFDLEIVAEKEIDGIGMGVLKNGTPFLTLRGLARMCGVDHSMIVRMTAQWQDVPLKPREQRIREIMRARGADDSVAFIAAVKDGTIHHLVPDSVCMAVLEYYAFEANSTAKDHALNSYRVLAGAGFSAFIYQQVGYNPQPSANLAWQKFHDRVSLSYNTVPAGFFSVFKEIADLMVTLIREGADLGNKFIPDISVGMHWGKFWTGNNLDAVYGMRMKYEHNYPDYFPQAMSNPQSPFCYPDDALGEFRKWVRTTYLPKHLPAYIAKKVSEGMIGGSAAQIAIQALNKQSAQIVKPI